MPVLLSQVPEWGHSCARSLFLQHQKGGRRIRSSREQICSSSAWARASAQKSLSGCILSAWGYHVVSQETDHMGQVAVPPCASASPLENRGTPCLTWVLTHFTILNLLNDGFFRFLKSMPPIFWSNVSFFCIWPFWICSAYLWTFFLHRVCLHPPTLPGTCDGLMSQNFAWSRIAFPTIWLSFWDFLPFVMIEINCHLFHGAFPGLRAFPHSSHANQSQSHYGALH